MEPEETGPGLLKLGLGIGGIGCGMGCLLAVVLPFFLLALAVLWTSFFGG